MNYTNILSIGLIALMSSTVHAMQSAQGGKDYARILRIVKNSQKRPVQPVQPAQEQPVQPPADQGPHVPAVREVEAQAEQPLAVLHVAHLQDQDEAPIVQNDQQAVADGAPAHVPAPENNGPVLQDAPAPQGMVRAFIKRIGEKLVEFGSK